MAHVRQLAARYDALRARGLRIAVLGPGSPAQAAHLARRLSVPFPVLGDPTGATLDALGLTRRVLLRHSGAVVVDREGVVRAAHRTVNPGRALPLAEILSALDGAAGSAGG